MYESFGDKDGIVVALSENKCGKDDVYDVELYVEYVHQPENPYPAHSQRHEGDECYLYASERKQQKHKHDEPAYIEYLVEVVGERQYHSFHKGAIVENVYIVRIKRLCHSLLVVSAVNGGEYHRASVVDIDIIFG